MGQYGYKSYGGVTNPNAESETWNMSETFVQVNIARLTIETNLFERIARFGKHDINEMIDPREIPNKRVEAFDMLIFCLRQLISNADFTIYDKYDQLLCSQFVSRLDYIEEMSKNISDTRTNFITHEQQTIIHEDHFRKCLDGLSKIKEELFRVLNKASLIFRQSEGTNLDELMASIYNGG